MNITIDGKKVNISKPMTVLKACEEQGIHIPTLCHDDRTSHFTSCFLCTVEVEGARGLVPACSTMVRDNMNIKTDSEAVLKSRKLCLELLYSDHAGDCNAPCKNTCPTGIDIQSYLAHVKNGDYDRALITIKERNPLPIVCGRVCPHPCEDECRRNLIDEAVSINHVKRFAADRDLFGSSTYKPEVQPNNGKKVAIVGAGPAGLTCAYYLAPMGYEVEIFEMTDKPGGMLHWGIPEYRLPEKTLRAEIDVITSLGVKVHYNKTLGKDFTVDELNSKYDAVFIGIGAQKSSPMRVKNEETEGVYGGIHFLADVVKGKDLDLGDNVVVVGGGNTAIDAVRTSVRLGVKNVTIVYRRTKEQMPAEDFEIYEAEEEGVKFNFLRSPLEVVTEGGKITGLKCQVMKLGEPDASGRRRPVPVEGEIETVKASTVISAIGQAVDTECLTVKNGDGLELSKWNTIVADEKTRTFETNIPGVFAGGDVVSGPYIAIAAIAQGRYAAYSMDAYLQRKPLPKDFRDEFNFTLGEDLKRVNMDFLPKSEKLKRQTNSQLEVKKRLSNFDEVDYTFTEEAAVKEAERCLNCGCLDAHECKIKEYGKDFGAVQAHVKGAMREKKLDESSNYMVLDSSKCIKCGKCVRVCDELKGVGALGFVRRGFDTDVLPSLEQRITKSSCVECGQCESACPTGAILDKSVTLDRLAQFPVKNIPTICKECSLGCDIEVSYMGDYKPIQIRPGNRGTVDESMLCKVGRYKALENYEESFSFDITKYSEMSLYDKSIENVQEAINEAEVIVNYNVDIFNYFAPVSAALKKSLENGGSNKDVVFFNKSNFDIFGFKRFPIRTIKTPSSKELLSTLNTDKRLLLLVEETKLAKKDLDTFVKLKAKKNIKFLNLVHRSSI